MTLYTHDFYKWVKGKFYKLSPISMKHDALTSFF